MRRQQEAFLVVLSLVALYGASGCVLVSDFGRFSGGEGDGDAGVVDRPDGSPDGYDGGLDAGAGACNPACAEGETCVSGECQCGSGPACGAGEACCGGACADVQSNTAMCGACGTVCEGEVNSVAECATGACVQRCEMGFQDCDAASPGCEAALLDAQHCGSCGNACPAGEFCATTGGGQSCVSSCSADLTECSGACIDTESDVTHCGDCTTVCPMLPQTTRTCSGGECSYACVGTFVDCNGDLGTPATSDGCEAVRSLYYADGDGDGVGTGSGMAFCPGDAPGDWVTTTGDCDDGNGARFPGNPELCNGLDEDCDEVPDDGLNWMGIAPGDACSCEPGSAASTVSCADSTTASCTFPAERCNGLDDDCDGVDDNGFECAAGASGSCTITLGACTATGTRSCDGLFCTWDECIAPAEMCNGGDDDCDGFVDDGALALGPRIPLVADSVVVADLGLHPTVGMGGAVAYLLSSATTRRVIWQRLSEDGTPDGAPVVVATGSDLGFPLGMGWDGGQWSIFFSRSGVPSDTFHARVTSTGGLTPEVLIGAGEGVQAASDGNSVGVAMRGGPGLRAGIYRDGTWTRPVGDLATGRFDGWVDVEPTSGGEFVAASASADAGNVVFRTFSVGSLGTERTVLTDAVEESRSDLAVDPAGRLALTAQRSEAGTGTLLDAMVYVFDLASGAQIGASAIGRNNFLVSFQGGEFFADQGSIQRVRSSDAALYPESYFSNVGASATVGWRGAYRVLRVTYDFSSSQSVIQGIGCP